MDINAVKSYAQDLKSLLEEADIAQRKSFIKSFVKRIIVDGKNVKVSYKLPGGNGLGVESAVLPIETLGGAGGIRTPASPMPIGAFSQVRFFRGDLSGGAGGIRTRYLLTASQTFSQVNYGP